MTITVSKKDSKELYNSLSFISKALPKNDKDSRYMLQYAEVKNNRLASTDGHRAHVMTDISDRLDITEGTYKLIKTAKEITLIPNTEEGTYPNIEQIIPDIGNNNPKSCLAWDNPKTPSQNISQVIGKLYEYALVDYAYVSDLQGIDNLDVYATEALSPILFKNCNHLAVIMPIRKT